MSPPLSTQGYGVEQASRQATGGTPELNKITKIGELL